MRRASCSCGACSLSCEGEPVRVSICHCFSCQQRTGSIFGVQARFPRDQVKSIEGNLTEYVRVADSGNPITFHFCARCGSTLYYQLHGLSDFVAVPVGAFSDPNFPTPSFSVYEARKHAWADLPPHVEHMD